MWCNLLEKHGGGLGEPHTVHRWAQNFTVQTQEQTAKHEIIQHSASCGVETLRLFLLLQYDDWSEGSCWRLISSLKIHLLFIVPVNVKQQCHGCELYSYPPFWGLSCHILVCYTWLLKFTGLSTPDLLRSLTRGAVAEWAFIRLFL